MEQIKSLPPMERPREKLQYRGAQALSDRELLAILLGSGTPRAPLNRICDNLLAVMQLRELAQMDMDALCRFKGIGPAKATVLLAAAELSRRLQPTGELLVDEQACYMYLRPLLEKETQLQYIILLLSPEREMLAFSATGSVLPDRGRMLRLAAEAGAGRILLARNGWPAFSNAEGRYMLELKACAAALGMLCEGLMAVGPERFKLI